jgi:hypothetical protein
MAGKYPNGKGRPGRPPGSNEDVARDKAVKQAQFLEAYMKLGRVDLATKHVGIPYHLPYCWAREEKSDFKQRWNEARDVVAQHLEDSAYKRAHTGVQKPIYQRGVLVDYVREYSDTLTMFLLKGLKPQVYREHVALEHSGDPEKPVKQEVRVGLSDEAAEFVRQKVLGVGSKGEGK